MWVNALLILGAYLLGAFPVVYLIGKVRGFDLSKEEDMHISLWQKVGRGEGVIGISWDVAKGAIAVIVAKEVLGFGLTTVAGVGIAVVIGEMWSIFLRFRGEKANTTGLGMAAALAYQALPFILVPVALGAGIRIVPRLLNPNQSLTERLKFGGSPSLSLPLGMLIGFALLPLGCWYLKLPMEVTLTCLALFFLIMLKRLTPGLRNDLKTTNNRKSIVLNRLLFDRSYL